MTAPVPVIEGEPATADPADDLVHIVCGACLKAERRPLLAFCGHDLTDDVQVNCADRCGHPWCSLCRLAFAYYLCPTCGRKAVP